MQKKKILISCGPIPGQLDSVKVITNKFKGGLALLTAKLLSQDFDVEIVKWRGTDFDTTLPVHNISDVYDYYEKMKAFKADAYILAGAVANLVPALPLPWGSGKFPSHNYKEGDKFNIEFTIAPRIIDKIKEWHPQATLIGYKLFDGTEEEIMHAAWETLTGSRSNVVFANHPATAKSEKIAVMPDGTHIKMSFNDHIDFIKRVINLDWYRTDQVPTIEYNRSKEPIAREFMSKIAVEKEGYTFGTVAARTNDGFMTTTRGKRNDGYCYVDHVDHAARIVYATEKATLNAPVLDLLFEQHPETNWVLHGHKQLMDAMTFPYAFSGTTEESASVRNAPGKFNIQNHGYYICFKEEEHVRQWLAENY